MNPTKMNRQKISLFLLSLAMMLLPWPGIAQTEQNEALSAIFETARDGQSRAFERLLRNTYLGHAAELPDANEPVVVLQAYLDLQKHDQVLDRKGLDSNIAKWRKFTRQYPDSRYAHLGLGKAYRERGAFTGSADLGLAAASYIRAGQLGMAKGRLLFTRQISDLMIQTGNLKGLDEAFKPMLSFAKASGIRSSEQYLVILDYADGLAGLRDERAWDFFEQALALQPGGIEAVNRYAQRLLESSKAEEALTVLENQITREERIRFVRPAFLRRQALKMLGRDTAPADAEIVEIRDRFGKRGAYFPEKDLNDPLVPVDEQFAHSNSTDDCRSTTYAQNQQCDSSGTCLYPYVVNLAEIMYNEARGEAIGVQDAVGWTVRDRAFQGVSCDAYVGGVNYTSCRTNLPCGDPSRCAISRYYCCVEHGATTTVGTAHSQFNDAHVTLSTLISSGQFYEAQLVWWGAVPDPTTGFIPSGLSGCTVGCGSENYCTTGVNFDSPSPNGPMEYLGYNYCAAAQTCKIYKGNVCGSNVRATSCSSGGTGDNYFWNRRN